MEEFFSTLILEILLRTGAFIRWIFFYRFKKSLKEVLKDDMYNRYVSIIFYGFLLLIFTFYIVFTNS